MAGEWIFPKEYYKESRRYHGNSPVAQQLKDLISLLRQGFDPWPGNFYVPWTQPPPRPPQKAPKKPVIYELWSQSRERSKLQVAWTWVAERITALGVGGTGMSERAVKVYKGEVRHFFAFFSLFPPSFIHPCLFWIFFSAVTQLLYIFVFSLLSHRSLK